MTYNPADYNAVVENAKKMSKDELEKDYVRGKDKRHSTCCEVIGIIILGLFAIFAIGAFGYAMGQENLQDDVSNQIDVIQNEICPMINEEYKSPMFFESTYGQNQIVCD